MNFYYFSLVLQNAFSKINLLCKVTIAEISNYDLCSKIGISFSRNNTDV